MRRRERELTEQLSEAKATQAQTLAAKSESAVVAEFKKMLYREQDRSQKYLSENEHIHRDNITLRDRVTSLSEEIA